MNASVRPSGDQTGLFSSAGSSVTRLATPRAGVHHPHVVLPLGVADLEGTRLSSGESGDLAVGSRRSDRPDLFPRAVEPRELRPALWLFPVREARVPPDETPNRATSHAGHQATEDAIVTRLATQLGTLDVERLSEERVLDGRRGGVPRQPEVDASAGREEAPLVGAVERPDVDTQSGELPARDSPGREQEATPIRQELGYTEKLLTASQIRASGGASAPLRSPRPCRARRARRSGGRPTPRRGSCRPHSSRR